MLLSISTSSPSMCSRNQDPCYLLYFPLFGSEVQIGFRYDIEQSEFSFVRSSSIEQDSMDILDRKLPDLDDLESSWSYTHNSGHSDKALFYPAERRMELKHS